MNVKQVATILNTISTELLGEAAILTEDLSDVVSIGQNLMSVAGVENFTKAANDVIGKIIFVDRVYQGRVPSLLVDGWEYGSIVEKLMMDLPDAQDNESWNLVPGASYDPHIFYRPAVQATCWNDRDTFEIPISLAERQSKSAFNSGDQLNMFFSMIQNQVQNGMTLKLDALAMRVLNNLIGETIYADYGGGSLSGSSGTKAVNLLYLYNNGPNSGGTPLTQGEALTTPEFIRFAVMTITNYMDRLKVYSTLFNVGAKARFTPEDRMHIALLSEFKNAANAYLQSDTFHDQYTALPNADSVVYWQGSGTGYDFTDTSAIDIVTATGNSVSADGILGIIWDRDAAGISCMERRVTTQYNPKAEFTNFWHKMDAAYWNDINENAVVFFVA